MAGSTAGTRVMSRSTAVSVNISSQNHDDVIKWKHCPRNWPFVRGIPHTKASDVEL